MHWYQFAIAGFAVVVAAMAWHVPRAVPWIAFGAASFIASALWHNAGLPHAPAFGAATNLAICLLLYIFAEERWELRVWNAFHLMIVIDLLYLFKAIPPMAGVSSHYVYATMLEICNWLALLVIGAAGLTEMAFNHDRTDYRSRRGWLGNLNRALHAKRSDTVFWKRP